MSDKELYERIMAEHDVKRIDRALRDGEAGSDVKLVVEIAWAARGDYYKKTIVSLPNATKEEWRFPRWMNEFANQICQACYVDTFARTVTRGHRTR